MPLAPFIYQYDTVIFDMDGVITSEQHYWNCAALTVFEFLHSDKLYGDENIDAKTLVKNVADIRDHVFYHGKIINILKEKGVNSNWDLAYFVISLNLILHKKASPQEIYEYIQTHFHENILEDYDLTACAVESCIHQKADRASLFWQTISQIFQHWFLGDTYFYENASCEVSVQGKPGFIYSEDPIIDKDRLQKIMKSIYEAGIRIGIATGRPQAEMLAPLKSFGIDSYIDVHSKISYTYIKEAEKKLHGKFSLSKPHPYIFLKSLLGEAYPDYDIATENYDKSLPKKALIVGDAGADILAAQNMGSDFLAVLTGISGKKGRSYFEKIKATYIFDSLSDIYIEETKN